MTALQHTLFKDIPTEELNVPDSFAPTFNCCNEDCSSYFPDDCPDQDTPFGRRAWVVDIFDLNGKPYAIFLAAGPAALAFILAFLDNGITWHIVNHPSNKITHGEAYNYDTCISALMVAVNSLLGLPWLVASTVPCLMHISAMANTTSDGTTTDIQESRLTGFFTHVLVLGTIFALNVIKLIPLPVLYGVFLFMGLVALPAQQFWQRLLLFCQQPSRIAKTPYTEYLELNRVQLFTMIQLGFFSLLYVVKNVKAIAIAFPVMILLCIPVRLYLLPKIFNQDELTLLDGSPEEIEDWIFRKRQEDGAVKVVDADEEVDDAHEPDELKKLIVDVDINEDGVASIHKPSMGLKSLASSSRASSGQQVRQRRRRTKQVSLPLHDSFFRKKREKQSSIDRSIDTFMGQHGLRMPDVPFVIEDDEHNEKDTDSEISV